jgi:hypothetical protein
VWLDTDREYDEHNRLTKLKNGMLTNAATQWRTMWKRCVGFPSIIGKTSGAGVVNAVDVRSLGALTGLHVRCKPLANTYNQFIRTKGFDQAPCCLRLQCDFAEADDEVGPDHVLNPVWR